MKKILSSLVLLFLLSSQAVACWSGHLYYSEDICSEYSFTDWAVDEGGYYDKDLIKYRSIVRGILSQKIDLTQKRDYESFLVLEQKVKDYISLDKYKWKNRTLTCAIHIELDAMKNGTSLWVDRKTSRDDSVVLVEEDIDLYALDLLTRKSTLVFSDFKKIENITFSNNIIDEFGYKELIKEKYPDLNYQYTHYIANSWDTDFIGFSWWEKQENDSYDWFWGILAYENGIQRFSAYSQNLSFPNWDTDVHRPAYLLGKTGMIVYSHACGVSKQMYLLENNSNTLLEIRR